MKTVLHNYREYKQHVYKTALYIRSILLLFCISGEGKLQLTRIMSAFKMLSRQYVQANTGRQIVTANNYWNNALYYSSRFHLCATLSRVSSDFSKARSLENIVKLAFVIKT